VKVDQLIEQAKEMTAWVLTRIFKIARQDSEQETEGCLWITLRVMFSGQFVKTCLEIIFDAVLVTVKNSEHNQLVYALSSQHVIEQRGILNDAADPNG